jgi:SAM-dependent methyltransferase
MTVFNNCFSFSINPNLLNILDITRSGLRTLNDRKDESVELLRDLIRTQSFTGGEREIADLIARKFKIFGFEDVRIDGAGNVICKLIGSGEGPTLLYNGHMDTVPAGDRSLWEFDPFAAEIVNNTIVGRGACDMKGSIAAMMMAAYAIRRADVKLKGILILTMVVKEENAMEEGVERRVEFKVGSAYSLPCEDHSIDLLLCINTLHHLDRPVDFFNEVVRSLKEKGVFVIVDFHRMLRSCSSEFLILLCNFFFTSVKTYTRHSSRTFITSSSSEKACSTSICLTSFK